jgi:UDP-N-acetylmuramoyl-L-alanyl-D-glutamate--2,6-diaminopimelate ligase
MRLRQLLDPGVRLEGAGDLDPDILALTADSREVEAGTLFAALAGSRVDGRRFIDAALDKGAAAVLGDPSLAGRAISVPLILDPEPRRRLSLMAARFSGGQPPRVVAVTGTSGKTSVANLVSQIWSALGHTAGTLGTLGLHTPDRTIDGGLTTPDPVRLHALLREIADDGVDHLAIEASSHGLDQHRLDGIRIRAAAFTNLSHDHLDYHHTFEAYLAAKARLFGELLLDDGVAVLNADIPQFSHLRSICERRGLGIIDYGEKGSALRLLDQKETLDGQRLRIVCKDRVHEVATPLIGNFQAANLLAAIGLVLADETEEAGTVFEAASAAKGVPGRLQLIGRHPSGAPVFVDYAHKPDALEKVLATLRPYVKGRLSVVFGCGGDRDTEKRPLMGKIAVERADKVFITDDNPRSEEPAMIRRQILDAAPGAFDVADRAEAIHLAVSMLDVGDVLVVAGKGHETGQIVGAEVLAFDDADVVGAALRDASGGGMRASRPGAG